MATPQTFDTAAQYYDLFELKSQPMYANIMKILEDHFTQHGVTSVLDFACGTGAQAIPLAQKGYRVTACDISPDMLGVAQQKSPQGLDITWKHGDMRQSQMGTFDAVIAMLNAIGYLSAPEFITALRNIRQHLVPTGLFICDNANLEAIRIGGYVTGKMIDTAGEHQGTKFVRLCQSTIDLTSGRFTTQWEAYVQQGIQAAETFTGTWQRQIYTCEELEQMLTTAGFKVLKFYDRYGGEFHPKKTFSVLVVAERV